MDDCFSTDSSEDENRNYLLATGILPGIEARSGLPPQGAQVGKRGNIPRQFKEAYQRLMHDYFSYTPKYGERDFERRFRMPRSVFEKIYERIEGKGIFVQRRDAVKREGIHPLLRMTAAMRMLAYGGAADALDEYLQMSEDSIMLSTKEFCAAIVSEFKEEYMREPREEDLKRILKINAGRGFPGCIGSIDCQHWEWNKCPIAWVGQYKGKEKKPTIVLEAICDAELWIWHAFFGSPGSQNDINVLDHSPTIGKILAGEFPPSIPFKINKVRRTLPYYLADGIYPRWPLFAKTTQEATTKKGKAHAAAQEGVRKDIERAFGVLVSRFHILQRPSRMWYRSDISNVMKACIILHNMIVEVRRDGYESGMCGLVMTEEAVAMFPEGRSFEWHSKAATHALVGASLPPGMWAAMVSERETRITNLTDHLSLQVDLVEHIWARHGM